MSTSRVVEVLIDGKETVSQASREAEGGLSGFVSSAGGMLRGLAALAAGLALADFFRKSVEEAGKSREAMGQLEIAVNNSGASFKKMEPEIARTLDALSRTTKFSDDEFADAMRTMTLKTGDAAWSLKSLGLAADVAAAAGVPLETATNALAKAHEGQTKQLFLLIPQLKGVTDWQGLLEERTRGAAEAQMKQLGPMAEIHKQYGELQEAVGKAILGNKEFSEGGFDVAKMLSDLSSWIEKNQEAFSGVISATVSFARTLGTVLGPAMRIGGAVLLALSEGVAELSFGWQKTKNDVSIAVGEMLVSFGELVEKGSGLLRIFGVTVGDGMAKKLKDSGEEMIGTAQNMALNLEAAYTLHQEKVARTWRAITSDAKDTMKKGGDDLADETGKGLGKVEGEVSKGAGKIHTVVQDKLGESLTMVVKTTETAIRSLSEAAASQLPPEAAAKFDEHMKSLAANAATVEARLVGMKAPSRDAKDNTQSMAEGIGTVARGALDAAEAFGVIDQNASRALQSAINIAGAIGQIAGGNVFAGVSGLLGGVANIVSTMMAGDRERKSLMRANTTQLERLTKEVGNLRLDVTGEQFAGVQTALSSVIGRLAGGRGSANQTDVINALRGQGLGLSDLERVANELGIKIKMDSGALSVDGLQQLFMAMRQVEVGRFGSDFSSQLDATKTGFDVFGTDKAGQAQQLAALFAKFSPGLSGVFNAGDIAGSRTRLQELFTRLNSGGVSAGELGGLSGSQFLDAITSLLSLIGDIQSAGETGTGSGLPTGTGGGTPGTTTTSGLPMKTLGDVFDEMSRQRVSLDEYHVSSIGFLGRISTATETTADNTGKALGYLALIASGSGGADETIGRAMSAESRLLGSGDL